MIGIFHKTFIKNYIRLEKARNEIQMITGDWEETDRIVGLAVHKASETVLDRFFYLDQFKRMLMEGKKLIKNFFFKIGMVAYLFLLLVRFGFQVEKVSIHLDGQCRSVARNRFR